MLPMSPIHQVRSGVRWRGTVTRFFLQETAGQSGMEYAIVAALIGFAVASGSNTLMPALRTTFAAITVPYDQPAVGHGATVTAQVAASP